MTWRTRRVPVVPGVLLLLLALPAGAADLIIRQRVTTGLPNVPAQESTQYFSGNRMAVDGPDTRFVLDLDANRVTVVDKKDRSYYSETLAAMTDRMRGFQKRAEEMRQKLAAQMDKMPPEAREHVAKMLEATKPGGKPEAGTVAAAAKPTGRTERIAGYDAVEYVAESGGTSVHAWVAPSLRVSPAFRERSAAMSRELGETWDVVRVMDSLGGVDGVPLRVTIAMGGGAPTTTTEAVEVKQEAAPAAVFETPPGYRRVEPPSLERLEKGE